MRHFKSIKCTVLFLVLSFLFNGTAYSQAKIGDLIKAVKTVKEINRINKEQKQQGQNKTNEKDEKDKKGERKSESSDSVTLIVSADGPTKDEATKTALRSAIEQAYGTFVSANTTILNDTLVKDEIVTISNGNIKEYTEIASEQMPDGKMYVTLQATVSISKLIIYAQSKGAETEFAGATFGMNMRMKELNKQNEKKALDNLLIQIKQLAPYAFTWELNINEPRIIENGGNLLGCSNSPRYDCRTNIIRSLKNNPERYRYMLPVDELNLSAAIDWLCNFQNCYEMIFKIYILPNENTKKMANLITSTLNTLSLSVEERQEYSELNLPTSSFSLNSSRRNEDWILRSSRDEIEEFKKSFYRIINEASCNFKVVDNMNVESYFYSLEIAQYHYAKDYERFAAINTKFPAVELLIDNDFFVHGTGIFQYARVSYGGNVLGYNFFKPTFLDWVGRGEFERIINEPDFIIEFYTPKTDIVKYSNFRVKRK